MIGVIGVIGLRFVVPFDPPVIPEPGPAREAARAELSKPAYTAQEPSPLQRLAEWVWSEIGDLLDRASAPGPGGGWATAILIALGVLALVVAWVRLGPREARPPSGTTVFAEAEQTAAEHHAAAEAALAAGDLQTAVLERFRALVRGCEERGLLVPRPGRTAEEAARELAHQLPGAAAAVSAAATAFGEVRYGGRRATEAAHRAIVEADRDLRAATPESAS